MYFYYIYFYKGFVVRLKYFRLYYLKSIFLSLLPAVIWLFLNSAVNQHSHRVSEGYIISHAHPYKTSPSDSGPVKSHHHSKAEFLLLSLINNPVSSATGLFLLTLFLVNLPRLFNFLNKQSLPVKDNYQVHHYHAPPVL